MAQNMHPRTASDGGIGSARDFHFKENDMKFHLPRFKHLPLAGPAEALPGAPSEPGRLQAANHQPDPVPGLALGHDAPRLDPKTNPQQHQQKAIGGRRHGHVR